VNTAAPPIDWMALLVIAISAAVMIYLLRRLMRGMNQQDFILLRQARARGINPAEPQSVDFVLFVASQEAADTVSDELRKDGFATSMKQAQIQYARNRAKPGEPQDGYLVTAKRTVALYPAELAKLRERLNEIASAQKGIYCGWQIAARTAAPPAEAPK
jgi:phosphatidylserine/phosphatidylglycerophosphate/cardiolipin synthase-like enzyme